MTKVEIRIENGGWDVSAFVENVKIKSAWASNGSSAYDKARILAEYYRDDNGQDANIIWVDRIN